MDLIHDCDDARTRVRAPTVTDSLAERHYQAVRRAKFWLPFYTCLVGAQMYGEGHCIFIA